ncbi:MAG: protein kinase [Planctomycetes bacterium]|nr:protein kinase [Planctomycetota bacterium]
MVQGQGDALSGGPSPGSEGPAPDAARSEPRRTCPPTVPAGPRAAGAPLDGSSAPVPAPDPSTQATILRPVEGELARVAPASEGPTELLLGAGGRDFGRYRLVRVLGRGGMGVVYRALDKELQRTVALKVLLEGEGLSEEARLRFQREARVAARLSHPNIVPIHEVGEVEGKPFFTMELIEGESLQALLHRMGRLPTEAALRIAREAARALAFTHEQGLVHRDIKPANLLLARGDPEAGAVVVPPAAALPLAAASDAVVPSAPPLPATAFRVLLADFGLAKDLDADSRLTRTGQIMGTVVYMSPEQADGDGSRLGPASDLYSLGAVLYEMLCGSPPFEGTNQLKLLNTVLLDEPEPLRRRVAGLDPDLETIVSTAMAKNPARRYASARALAEDLERRLAGEVIHARPAALVYRVSRRIHRHRVFATILATLCLLAGASELTFGPLGYRFGFRVRVTNVVAGSPADASGLRRGDVLLVYDGQPIERALDLFEARVRAEDRKAVSVGLTVERAGGRIELVVPPGRLGYGMEEQLGVWWRW